MSRKHYISDSRISQRGIKIKPTFNRKKITRPVTMSGLRDGEEEEESNLINLKR